MSLLETKKLFLLDFDGTLVNTSRDILNSLNYMRQHFNLQPLSFDQAKKYIGIGQRKLIESAIAGDPKINLDEAHNIYKNHHEEHLTDFVTFYSEVEATLNMLVKQNKTLCIISNKYSYYVEEILKYLNNSVSFSLILGAENVESRKPDPAPIYFSSEKTKIPLSETVIIGDSPYDINAGKAAGITTVGITYGFGGKETIRELKPDHLVDKFSEILLI